MERVRADASTARPHFDLFINRARLLDGRERHARQPGFRRPRGDRPAQRSAEIDFFFSMLHTNAAAIASPAPMGHSASIRGGSASKMPSGPDPIAPRLPSERITDSGPMPLIRSMASRNCLRVISARPSSRSAFVLIGCDDGGLRFERVQQRLAVGIDQSFHAALLGHLDHLAIKCGGTPGGRLPQIISHRDFGRCLPTSSRICADLLRLRAARRFHSA